MNDQAADEVHGVLERSQTLEKVHLTSLQYAVV
jgi:hypothetical protein